MCSSEIYLLGQSLQTVYLVQFVVEAAGVANRFSLVVPSPQSGGGRIAVGALQAGSTIGTLERGTIPVANEAVDGREEPGSSCNGRRLTF